MGREYIKTGLIILLGLLANSLLLTGQEGGRNVAGTITDISNRAIAGVSVSVEGMTSEPAVSDENGHFTIQVPDGNAWLIISPLEGYEDKYIFLNNRDELTIYLTSGDMKSEYEKTTIPLASRERRNIISTSSTYDAGDQVQFPYETVDQYFQGSIPGMNVSNHSGMPGSATTTNIRGLKSLYTNIQPLYIIDGIPIETFGLFCSELEGYEYNPLTSLEPFDIANVTILNDGFAGALYGLRGSNGVVMIETLKPTELKTTIDFVVKTGISQRAGQTIPQMDNVQYKTYVNELLLTSEYLEENFIDYYPALYSDPTTENYHRYKNNTNWQDESYHTGLLNDVLFRIKGGDEIARYGLSVGYVKHEGILKNSDFERLNIRLVGTFNIFNWLRMYISTSLNSNTSNSYESALSRETSLTLTSLAKSPMMTPYSYDRDGNKLSTLDDVGSLGISNPYAILENFKGQNQNYHSLNSIRLQGDISDHFKMNVLFGINLNTLNEEIFMPNYGMALYEDGTAYNVSKITKNFLFSTYSDNSISFIPGLGKLHSLKVDAGFRMNLNRFEQDVGITKNSHENDEYESLAYGVFYMKEIFGQNEIWNRTSIYSNLNYGFKDRYLVNLTTSVENSTRLGRDADMLTIGNNPFGVFFSAGAAWRISSESILKDIHWLDDLKLRCSYSISGNDDIGNTSAYNYLRVDHYRESSAMIPGNLTDGTLKNETSAHTNAGLDVSIIGNRLNFSINYYHIHTWDMLVFEPQEFYMGYDYLPLNNGSLTNRGLELAMNFRVVNHEKFKWDLALACTPWQESLVRQIGDDQLITSFPGGEFITKTGSSILEFYGYQFNGVYSTTAEALEANLVNDRGIPFIAGDAKYEDFSGPEGVPDGVINDYDKVSLGSPLKEVFGGVNTRFHYGRWSLDLKMYFALGNDVFNYLRYENEKMSDVSNQSKTVLNRWFYEGQETDIPRAVWDDPVGNSSFSSRWIEDGSFFRIQDITLSYSVPDKFLVFENLMVFITGSNLFTFSNYLGYDPEFSYSYSPLLQGIDYGLMPIPRKLMLGVKIGL